VWRRELPLEKRLNVPGTVKHAQDFDTVSEWAIKDEVFAEAFDRPEP